MTRWIKKAGRVVAWPVRKTKATVEGAMVSGLIRHIATFLGGVMVAQSGADPAQTESVVGALVTILGLVWSVIEKRQRAVGP